MVLGRFKILWFAKLILLWIIIIIYHYRNAPGPLRLINTVVTFKNGNRINFTSSRVEIKKREDDLLPASTILIAFLWFYKTRLDRANTQKKQYNKCEVINAAYRSKYNSYQTRLPLSPLCCIYILNL